MIEFLTDPILRGPTWGCMFMGLASSLIGVLVFLKKRSLLAETLSHATYPGACLGVAFLGVLFPHLEEWAFLAVLGGAFLSSFLGLKAMDWLEQKGGVRTDAALCFVLAVFFGMGVVIASIIQRELPLWYKQVQMLLFGQAATMSDLHIWIYGGLAVGVILFLSLTFRSLQSFLFDRDFASVGGVLVRSLERMVFMLLLLSLIIGIRSVGVVLMSGMLIAPAVAARQCTDRLQTMFYLSGFFGVASSLLGNYLSVAAHVPTGPMIVLVATFFALGALLLAPKRGVVFRFARIFTFRLRCLEENVLKGIWKKGTFSETPSLRLRFALWRLKREGWLNARCELTPDGKKKAASIVRSHRLWELYLASSLGLHAEKVHGSAEEMEHIITPEMEMKLTHFLEDPKHDPHDQPIPEKG